MSTIKCPNCALINFASAQFCKRCNLALNQPQNNQAYNQTQILNNANNTHVRPVLQQERRNDGNNYQANQYNQPNSQSNQYSQPNHGANRYNQPNQYSSKSYQQKHSNEYSLPKFPEGQRPPQYDSYQQNAPYYSSGNMSYRRLGSEIALHINSNLPEFCVKCGQPTSFDGNYVGEKYRWHHPAVYAALISPLIYAILAACLSHRFTVNVPLCGTHLKKRDNSLTGILGGGFVAAFLLVLLVYAGAWGFAFFVFMAAFIVLILNYEYGYKSLRPSRVEGSYYYLKGASEEFLQNIPY